eukprot:CAMPEP_0171078248 /NCGR_PEP_ID=MMETSP0766_2-20121228/14534_1 /TAXON_ID=439317 /ORGANISM="Gambierdiscus australes, Strain CAWD 149" /LENGTH=143 /DNA_ID=CAMNT_0011535365 /DNA_START=18 /DNA_END=450 /DNA_ORIENTATION=+
MPHRAFRGRCAGLWASAPLSAFGGQADGAWGAPVEHPWAHFQPVVAAGPSTLELPVLWRTPQPVAHQDAVFGLHDEGEGVVVDEHSPGQIGRARLFAAAVWFYVDAPHTSQVLQVHARQVWDWYAVLSSQALADAAALRVEDW